MSYPGDQVTAPPQQWWQDQSGQHDYAPVRAGFGDERFEPGRARLENAVPGSAGQLGTAAAPRPREGQARYANSRYAPPQPRDGHGAHRAPELGAQCPPEPGAQRPLEPGAGYPPARAERDARHRFPAAGQYAVPPPRAPESMPFRPPAPERMPFSAPTWSDTLGASEGGTGVALAERPDPGQAAAGSLSRPDVAVRAGGRSVRAAGRTRAAAARARKTARRKVQTRRRVVAAGVCLPAIALGAVLALQRPGGHAPARVPAAAHVASAGSPASHPSPSLGPWQHIGSRAADPSPLTLAQLFPARFTAGSGSFTRTIQLGGTRCQGAVFGSRLQAAVRKDSCTQVMRASYLDAAQKLMGTIGVLNLATSADAGKAGKVTGASEFIGQLTAASGPTHTLTKGTGLEIAEIKGHYLILTWVEFTTHRAPRTAAQRAQLKAFSADLISRTANISLTSRMVTGVPQIP